MQHPHHKPRWDIFCRVVDNFGDIGVCWRLAKQLAEEHGLVVRLWVDDLASLQALNPHIDPQLHTQSCQQVEVCYWPADFPTVDPADVVIEAFACELPASYVAAMAAPSPQPSPQSDEGAKKGVWINLEYLSAEAWVDGCHGLPSPHPQLKLTKYFFFPGFTPATGGLLRECDLLQQRDIWQQTVMPALRQTLALPQGAPDEILLSLFCYDNAQLDDLLDQWQASVKPVRCLLPTGKALARVAHYFGKDICQPGDILQRDNLAVHVLPFLQQQDYDRLLWSCDCNFVRGEDSFVRAQWAGRPMVWQIYPQQQDAHRPKLEAFLDRYCAGLPEEAANALRAFHLGWNGDGQLDWNGFARQLALFKAHAGAWEKQLSAEPDLASKLVIFCRNRV